MTLKLESHLSTTVTLETEVRICCREMAVLVCNQVTTKVTSSARTKTVAVVERDNQTLVSISVLERRTSVPDPDL